MIPFIPRFHGRCALAHRGMALINYAPKPIRSSAESHERPITRLTGRKRNYSREGEHRQWNSMHGNACVENFVTGRARAAHAPRRAYFVPSRTRYAYRYDIDEPGYKKKKGKRMKKGKKSHVYSVAWKRSQQSGKYAARLYAHVPCAALWLQAFVLAINLHARFIGVFT